MRLLTSLILCSIISVTLYPQSVEIPPMHGKKALLFSFSGLNLGGGLGGKYWLTDELSLRAAMDLSTTSSETDDRTASDPSSELRQATSTYITGTVALLRTFLPSETLLPYCGFGGGMNVESWKSKTITSGGATRSTHDSSRRFHLTALIGAEVWITKNISLSGEQTVSFSSSFTIDGPNSSSQRFMTGTSYLMLAIYLL